MIMITIVIMHIIDYCDDCDHAYYYRYCCYNQDHEPNGSESSQQVEVQAPQQKPKARSQGSRVWRLSFRA